MLMLHFVTDLGVAIFQRELSDRVERSPALPVDFHEAANFVFVRIPFFPVAHGLIQPCIAEFPQRRASVGGLLLVA